MGAVINRRAYEKIGGYVADARANATIVAGGTASDATATSSRRLSSKPPIRHTVLLQEEIFGPVVTVLPFDDAKWSDTLALVNQTSSYALTGAVFGAIQGGPGSGRSPAQRRGNFYINDKPTGAVVGQQPFGGARGSGTNDKAGSKLNLARWVSARTVKETFNAPTASIPVHAGTVTDYGLQSTDDGPDYAVTLRSPWSVVCSL